MIFVSRNSFTQFSYFLDTDRYHHSTQRHSVSLIKQDYIRRSRQGWSHAAPSDSNFWDNDCSPSFLPCRPRIPSGIIGATSRSAEKACRDQFNCVVNHRGSIHVRTQSMRPVQEYFQHAITDPLQPSWIMSDFRVHRADTRPWLIWIMPLINRSPPYIYVMSPYRFSFGSSCSHHPHLHCCAFDPYAFHPSSPLRF